MNNITKSLDNLNNTNFTNIKPAKDLQFYLTLLSIARELFSARKNFAAYRLIDESSQPNDADIIHKLLDNFYNNGESVVSIKRLNSIEELISKCNTSITASDLVLIKYGFDEIIKSSSEVLLHRIEKLLKNHTTPHTLTTEIRSSILHYNQAHENTAHEKYNTIINFIYLIILHLKFFFTNSNCKYIKNNITEDFFYCDYAIINNKEKSDFIFNLYKDYQNIYEYNTELSPLHLTPDEFFSRITNKFGFEEARRYCKITGGLPEGKTEIANKEVFAQRLLQALNASGKTQASVAHELNIPKTTLNSYFSPTEKIPNAFPNALAYALNITPDYLAGKTDQPNQFLDCSTKPLSIIYTRTPETFSYGYQKSAEYHELKEAIKNIPNPFEITNELLKLSERCLRMIALYKKSELNPEFLWRGINDAGKELNQEKIEKCTELIKNFRSENQINFTNLDKGNDKLAKVYFKEVYPLQNELARKLQELEKQLASVIIPK